MSKSIYVSEREKCFRFNDHVCIEMLFGVPIEKRTGRLVQVRKGCGQFGTDVYFIRLRDGSLMTFENCMMRQVDDERFVEAFYRSNGVDAPEIPPQPVDENDSEDAEYSIRGKWGESGFIVERPKQPETPGSFAIAVVTPTCHNRPEFQAYEHPSGELIEHRMSQPCKSWSTGDRATPVPVAEGWNCAGCRWLPREDVLRFAQITDEPGLMAALVELAA